MGWANHRAIRLVDLAALTFRTNVRAQLRKGVGWSALHSFGCTAALRRIYYRNEKRAQAKEHPHAKFK